MRYLFQIIVAICIFASSGCEKEAYQDVTVIKDCTGVYLRFENKDYLVCNAGKVAPYQNGAKVSAVFKRIESCEDEEINPSVCYMLHVNEGWIEVKKISSP